MENTKYLAEPDFVTIWTDASYPPPRRFNLLFLGNSITSHGKCGYWWGAWGMAASSEADDYVHLVVSQLEKYGAVSFDISGMFLWEALAHDRAQPLGMMESAFKGNLDAVIVQMGENVISCSTMAGDLSELLEHIKSKATKAKIMVLGNFWPNDALDEIKKAVCQKMGVAYISLKDLQTPEYFAGLGATVYGDNGEAHTIEHAGVAQHPGNKAMIAIAERIVATLGM